MHNLEANFGHWILRFRWPVIILILGLVFLAATGGKNLAFSTNYRVFFSADNPELQAFDALENMYNKNDNVLFVVTPKDGNVFTPETLSVIELLTESAWQIPHNLRVDSISNFQHTEANGDELVVKDLVKNATELSEKEIEKIRRVALSEPLLVQRLIAKDGRVTGVNVTIQLPGIDETKEVPEVIKASRELAQKIREDYPNIEVRLSGMALMNNAFAEASKGDMATIVPVSFLIMLIFLALLLQDFQRGVKVLLGVFGALTAIGLSIAMLSLPLVVNIMLAAVALGTLFWAFPATMLTVVVIMLAIVTAMGMGGHVGFPLTPPSASAPTIILTVAIANSVHVLISFLHSMHQGLNKKDAIVESLRINLQPVFLTSLTTAIGFLTMNFSDVPPFQHLGNFVAFGVVASFFLATMFLPAVISLLPVKVRVFKDDKNVMMDLLGNFVVKYRTGLLWGMSIFAVVLISFISKNELNDVFVEYFDESVEFRQDADYTTEHLTGLYIADYSLPSNESGGISNPEYLAEVKAFSDWYRAQPETIHVNVITDVMLRLNKNMHGDEEKWYALPKMRDLAAQYLLLYELSLPYGLDLNNQINVDKSATRMTATLKTMSTNDLLALEQRAHKWLEDNTKIIRDAKASGPSIMFGHIGKRNIVSMLAGTTLALILISLILIIALRSVKIGLVSMIPNLIPAAMAFGLWGLLVGEVGLALSVVTGMTLGIVVDDTVHFLSKYLRARREKNYSVEDAVRYAFHTVGVALVTTSVVLIAGFYVLSTSSFELNAGMGMLTAIVIFFAIIADFFLLPPLLMKIEGKKNA
jgi:predicted RND superfamily exporter protein